MRQSCIPRGIKLIAFLEIFVVVLLCLSNLYSNIKLNKVERQLRDALIQIELPSESPTNY